MAGMTNTVHQQWIKCFPPTQQRGIMGATQGFLSAYKLAPNSIASSTVLTADPELIIPMVQAGIPYNVSIFLNLTASAALGSVQFNFASSTATVQTMALVTQYYTAAGVQTNGAVAQALSTAVTSGTAAIQVVALVSGTIVFATPGSFSMNLAQAASSATATVVDINSMMLIESAIPSVTM